jgi:hypothetical protein
MTPHLWHIVRADIHLDTAPPMEWYFVRDAENNIIAGPFREHVAAQITAAHNAALGVTA